MQGMAGWYTAGGNEGVGNMCGLMHQYNAGGGGGGGGSLT